MKTVSKKSTITIITLSCLLAVAVASTIILAAFSAARTSTTTITFAEGLTVTLTPKGTANIRITADPEGGSNSATFTYAPNDAQTASLTNNDSPVTLDGINAALNKDGYIAYRVELKDGAATPAAIAGNWAQGTDANADKVVFTPTADADWEVVLTLANTSDWTVTPGAANSGIVTFAGAAKWEGTSGVAPAAKDMFSSIVIQGKATPSDVNALQSMTINVVITLKADTANAPTFA